MGAADFLAGDEWHLWSNLPVAARLSERPEFPPFGDKREICRVRTPKLSFKGRPAWTKLHRRWLAGLRFEQTAHHVVLQDYTQAVEAAKPRRDRLTAQTEALLPDWTLAPVVAALQTMRGMALVNAATLTAETDDPSRFANPCQLMACLGLVPCEHSSGASVRRGGLTMAGNRPVRRLLIEAAWTYRFPAGSAASCYFGRRRSPDRSARSPGRRSCGSARAIASSPATASWPMSSLPRSPASWQPAGSGEFNSDMAASLKGMSA